MSLIGLPVVILLLVLIFGLVPQTRTGPGIGIGGLILLLVVLWLVLGGSLGHIRF